MKSDTNRSSLERILSIFAEVRGGEGTTALLLALNVFLLLTCYYIMKPVREALILAGGGARLLNVVTVFFVACLALFYILAQFKVPLGVIFFLWIGIFNVSIIAQFWSFANDLYTPEQGKRLFAIIGFGASAGAVAGPYVARMLIEPLGMYQLLLIAGAILGLSLVFTNYVDSRARKEPDPQKAAQPVVKEEPIGKEGAYKLVFQNRYLLTIALLILFLNWVNTTGEYILGRVVTQMADSIAATQPGFDGYIYRKVLRGFLSCCEYCRPADSALSRLANTEVLGCTDSPLGAADHRTLRLCSGRVSTGFRNHPLDKDSGERDRLLASKHIAMWGTTFLAFQTKHFAMVNLGFVVVWIVLAVIIGRTYRQMVSKKQTEARTATLK